MTCKIFIIAYLVILSFNSSVWSQNDSNIKKDQRMSNSSETWKNNSTSIKVRKMVNSSESWKNATNVYEFQALDIDGNLVEMSKYQGRVLLIAK